MEADAIGKKQFWRDGMLHTFTIPKGTRLIGDWAFYGCTELARIEIPTSIEFIGKDAFAGCDKLEQACLYGEGEFPNMGKIVCHEELMALALRYFQGQTEIVSAGKGGFEPWILAWDQACHRFLDTSDADGFRPFLAGGEEDYADDDREREQYCRMRRLLKARIIMFRLLTGASDRERLFYLERLYKNDMALELLREVWTDPKRVVELLEEAKVLTKDKCLDLIERLPEECVEMKALLLQRLSGESATELDQLWL